MLMDERTPYLRRTAVLVLLLLAVSITTSCKRKTPANLGQTGSMPYGTAVTWGPLKPSRFCGGRDGGDKGPGCIGSALTTLDSILKTRLDAMAATHDP